MTHPSPLCTPSVAVSEQQGRRGNEEQSGDAACCGTVTEEVARGQRKTAPTVDDDLAAHALLCIQILSLTVICDSHTARGSGGHHLYMIQGDELHDVAETMLPLNQRSRIIG